MAGSCVQDDYLSAILHRTPLEPPIATAGTGIEITLKDGRTMIDAVGGAAVTVIGNGHPAVVRAIQEQVEKLSYVYNMQLSNEPAEELANLLVATSKGAFAAVGFVAGGTEAMESCIKLARQYYFEIGQPHRVNFIARKQSFHGNSIATLALASHPGRRLPYETILPTSNYHHVSPACALWYKNADETDEEYVERLAEELDAKFQELGPETVIAFVAETVVGAANGVGIPPTGYFKAVRQICNKYGALLILDEVMSGMGRMGTLHAWESFGDGARPDIQAVAKGLGGGYAPIGALLINQKVASAIRDKKGMWKHGHTYQAHPISCAAALAVQNVIHSENLLKNICERGAQLEALLRARLTALNSPAKPFIVDIRGRGGFWGIEFEPDPAKLPNVNGVRFGPHLSDIAFKNGLLIFGMSGSIDGNKGEFAILAPAFNVTSEEIEKIGDVFSRSVEEALRDAGVI
ncbi:pyridoxal phosphate-dependent transferase [Cantharellus anzutake]|uniref:pyridoxal phosphate-dependent transferase n=1 Tax=Cantharellus anzutake TaxID=1750568 RepID=UPI0019039561|nr:pyridoxal phosphate-dependent transferase [Cantharellus anzutake]KAF8333065.1 pyridoxal phosphate-dependent transferase [Cantharellus anzutake]